MSGSDLSWCSDAISVPRAAGDLAAEASCPGPPGASGLCEATWSGLMGARRAWWGDRMRDTALARSKRTYAANRESALGRPYGLKVAACGRTGLPVKCGCRTSVRYYTCRRFLVCADCARTRNRMNRARIRASLLAQVEATRRGGRRGMKVLMLTITIRHSGDPGADRSALARGWRRFLRAYWKRYPRFPYVGTWEVTTGDDGLGHPHAHVVVVWPWRDWALIHRMWRRACPQSSNIDIAKASSPHAAAEYVSKYISKGVQAAGWTPELRARVAAGTYNTRWVFSSVRFWKKFEPCCPECGQKTVADVSVAESWRLDARVHRWRESPFDAWRRKRYRPDTTPDIFGNRWYQTDIRDFRENA